MVIFRGARKRERHEIAFLSAPSAAAARVRADGDSSGKSAEGIRITDGSGNEYVYIFDERSE